MKDFGYTFEVTNVWLCQLLLLYISVMATIYLKMWHIATCVTDDGETEA